MKVVYYLRERSRRELEAAGLDPAKWVRQVVDAALEERASEGGRAVERLPASGEGVESSDSGRTPVIHLPPREEGDDVRTDFKGDRRR